MKPDILSPVTTETVFLAIGAGPPAESLIVTSTLMLTGWPERRGGAGAIVVAATGVGAGVVARGDSAGCGAAGGGWSALTCVKAARTHAASATVRSVIDGSPF